MPVYVGAENGVARKAAEVFVGVNGVARRAKRVYVGDAQGVARLGFEREWSMGEPFTAQLSVDVKNRYESWRAGCYVTFAFDAGAQRYEGHAEFTISSVTTQVTLGEFSLSDLPQGVQDAMTSWRVEWSQQGVAGSGSHGKPWVGTVYIETK